MKSSRVESLDVYSAGLVYYQILTLKHPLSQFVSDAQDWREWRKAHLFSVCPDIRALRPDVESCNIATGFTYG